MLRLSLWIKQENLHKSVICVQHLYTFAMDKKEGVVSVEDGIRKLRLLDAKGKIWTQDVRLVTTDRDAILQDEYTSVSKRLPQTPRNSHTESVIDTPTNTVFLCRLRTFSRKLQTNKLPLPIQIH